MPSRNTLESKMSYRIARSTRRVFMREDFADLGYSYDYVGEILRKFVKSGKLVDIGYGVYARGKISHLTGELVTDGPLPWLAKEYLARCGIEALPTSADIAHKNGSTQVPTGRGIGVRQRVRRKIHHDGARIHFEKRP